MSSQEPLSHLLVFNVTEPEVADHSGGDRQVGARNCCDDCDDGEGRCVYPLYGVAPHTCFYKIPEAVMGQSVELSEDQWPSNFELDPDLGPAGNGPRCGVYWFCPTCKRGTPYSKPSS